MSNISIDGIASEIAQALSDYTEEVGIEIEKEITDTSKKILAEIKSTAPRRTGKYAKGFKIKKEDKGSNIKRIIYNKDKPGLIHILEKGYSKRGGTGRVEGRPHVGPAEDKYIPIMERNIENIIKKGGR